MLKLKFDNKGNTEFIISRRQMADENLSMSGIFDERYGLE